MTKLEFFNELQSRLDGLPKAEADERFSFYHEMIDDRIEDGLSEEEAVAEVGTPEEIANQILSEIPLSTLVKEKVKKNRALRGWEIVLLILGFLLWFPLLIAALVVILSIYISIWAVVLSLYAVDLSLALCAVALVVGMFIYLFQGNIGGALMSLGTGILSAGLAILLFIGCVAISKGIIVLTKKSLLGVKSWFVRKED